MSTAERLFAAALAGLVAGSVQAQEVDPAEREEVIDEIVVTGTPLSQSTFTSPADVDVVTGEDKARQQRPGLGASIERLPGVSTLATGSQVGKPVIRGLSGNRIRVLSNDVALNFQQYGVRHPPNLDPYVSDRIELVRGPMSVLYGSDAIGGAVNLISTAPLAAPDGDMLLRGGVLGEYSSAFSERTFVAEGELARGGFGVGATLVSRESDGLEVPDEPTALETGDPTGPLVTGDVPFTDFEQTNGELQLGWDADWGLATLRYEGFRNEHNFVVPDPPPPDGDPLQAGGVGQDLENDIVQLKLTSDLSPDLTIEPSLTWYRNQRVSNPGPPEPLPRSFLPDAAVIDIERQALIGRFVLRHGEIGPAGFSGQIGAEFRREEQESTGSTMLSPGGDIDNYALFAFQTRDFGALTVNAGLRFDHYRQEADPGETREPSSLPDDPDLLEQSYDVVTGGVGASYRISEELVVAGNLTSGFRAPTLFDLFASGVHGGVAAFQQGDPLLDEERALSTDLQLRWRGERWRANATVYRYDISDYIFLGGTGQTNPAGLPVFQVSQDDAEFLGADLEVGFRANAWLEFSAVYETVDGELDAAGVDAPLLPADSLLAEVTFTAGRLGALEDAYLTIGSRWVSDKDSVGLLEPFGQFDTPPPPFGTGSTDSYNRIDVSAGFTLGAARIRLAVDNLTDEVYRDFLDTYKNITLSPGRDIRLSVAFGL